MSFRVGQKVVCVNEPKSVMAQQWMALGAKYPAKGPIYIIRKIVTFGDSSLGVLLAEIVNEHLGYSLEPAFAIEHFRPIVERETDISIFKALLVPGAKIRETVE